MGEPSDPSSLDRFRTWAKLHASGRTPGESSPQPVLPIAAKKSSGKDKRYHEKDAGIDAPLGFAAGPAASNAAFHLHTDGSSDINTSAHNSNSNNNENDNVDNVGSTTMPPPASPPIKSEAAGEDSSAMTTTSTDKPKPPMTTRMKNGVVRFVGHSRDALTHSWVNVLLVFVPVGIVANAAGLAPGVVFAMNAIAIIPLAGMLAYATESVAARLGDTLGALLNVSFGNAVELIIFIIALVKDEIRIVQASLVGSILSNLLLIMGMAFLIGGLRFQEQIYNNTVTQMSACLLSLAVTSLVLPTVFHASFSNVDTADINVLKISRGTSVILLLVYFLYLAFQLKSHAYLYESTPQKIIDEESHPGILADILNSSSSSDSSDSDSTDGSDTSGSVTTTKRIKRAFRNRRRRKSSVSSTNTASLPSVVSSPSVERHGHAWETQTMQLPQSSQPSQPSRRSSHNLGAIVSGDEADTDGEDHTAPRVRDFVRLQQTQHFEEPKRKRKQKRRHRHRYLSNGDEKHDDRDDHSSTRKMSKKKVVEVSPPRVDFAEDVEVVPGQATQARKPFGMTFARPSLRPTLPKMLSQNVFVSPPATTGSPMLGAAAPRTSSGLRRTSSLPDRLNRQASSAPRTQTDNIPPYPRHTTTEDEHDENLEEDEKPLMSRTSACVLLIISTVLVAICAEFMVDAIPAMLENSTTVSQAFIGLIILPIVSNAAEHVTAVTVAAKNKMDLSIGVSVGSSIQIALLVTPLVVIIGWCLDKDMSLYFNLFETVTLFITAFLVNFLILDGRSNYLEGSLLIAVYAIIAVCAFFYPDGSAQSSLGGNGE